MLGIEQRDGRPWRGVGEEREVSVSDWRVSGAITLTGECTTAKGLRVFDRRNGQIGATKVSRSKSVIGGYKKRSRSLDLALMNRKWKAETAWPEFAPRPGGCNGDAQRVSLPTGVVLPRTPLRVPQARYIQDRCDLANHLTQPE